ncbi:MAG: NTP pyrophosphohydrolase [Dactylosporangium sp.]|nr:hypothetical protein [Dactylosporangium sp.]NNJ62100.1 NTP pyrophosphohydrolase [Dactylosporangium sp.]
MPEVIPLLVVDAANVVGSVPDGWWRDRAGATARLRDRLAETVVAGGRPAESLLAGGEVVLVVEGRARHVPGVPGVRVLAASGLGDDAIVALVTAEGPARECVVVTADRRLRERVRAVGARVAGPGTLRRELGQ